MVNAAQSRLPLIYSGRVRNALQLAERLHRGMSRKSGDHPYLLHLVAVATVLSAVGADDDLLCAAYLHDAVEDTDYSLLEIEDEFGQRVASLVAAVSEPRQSADGSLLSREEKADHVLATMETAEIGVVALKAADLIANASDLVLDQRQQGFEHWEAMFGDRVDAKISYYLELGAILDRRLSESGRYPPLVGYLRERTGQLNALHETWESRS